MDEVEVVQYPNVPQLPQQQPEPAVVQPPQIPAEQADGGAPAAPVQPPAQGDNPANELEVKIYISPFFWYTNSVISRP